MADMERFEARLAASLVRFADEVPTEIDPQELAATIASSHPRRPTIGEWLGSVWLRPALRLALVAAALVGLLLSMLAVGQWLARSPVAPLAYGRLACGPSALTSGSGPVSLDCTSRLADPRLTGVVRVKLGEGSPVAGATMRSGTMELTGSGVRWSGEIELTTAPNGTAIGDAELVGVGDAAGLVVRLRVMTDGAMRWGVLGWIEPTQ